MSGQDAMGSAPAGPDASGREVAGAYSPPTGEHHRGVLVVGGGYVGLTIAAYLSQRGQAVHVVEKDAESVAQLRVGRLPFHEPGLSEIYSADDARRPLTTTELPAVLPETVIICVGTPLAPGTKHPSLAQLEGALDAVAPLVTEHTLLVIRSTVPVGTTTSLVAPRVRRHHERLSIAYCPERTIQGQALRELAELPQIVGGVDQQSTDRAAGFFAAAGLDVVRVSSPETAEFTKLVNNSHTDVLYGFGNEVAVMADLFGVDGNEVRMAANLGYPRPDIARAGFVGGSCLTKDPYLLLHSVMAHGETAPLAAAARQVNETLPRRLVEGVRTSLERSGRTIDGASIVLAGIAYKGRPPTDDTRGSSAPEIASALLEAGAEVRGCDPLVTRQRIASLGIPPCALAEGLDGADALLVLTDHDSYASLGPTDLAGMREPRIVFDMWGRLAPELRASGNIVYLQLGRGWPARL